MTKQEGDPMTIFDEVDEQDTRIAQQEAALEDQRERQRNAEYKRFCTMLGELLTTDDQQRLNLLVRHEPDKQLGGLATFVFDSRIYHMHYTGSAMWCCYSPTPRADGSSGEAFYAATRNDFVRGLAERRAEERRHAQA